jgi:hypothetical protein
MKKSRLLPVPAWALALLGFLVCAGCGEIPGNEIERVPDITLSDVFLIGAKAAANHGSDCGWLVPDSANPGLWKLDSTDVLAAKDGGGQPYNGVRLWNVDGDLQVRKVPFDASPYDGIIFKYRTNCTEVTPKFIDYSYRWAVYGINFKAFDYAQFNAPAAYKEIIVPFYKAVRNVEALFDDDHPDNNPLNFDYNQLRQLTFDMRSSVDGGAYWIDVVDFAFFVFKK